MPLHAPTLLVTSAMLSALIASLQLLASWRLQNVALLFWTVANVAMGAGSLIVALRPWIALAPSAVVGNGLVLMGLGFISIGIRAFDGLPLRIGAHVAFAAAGMAALALSLSFGDHVGERVIIMSIFTAAWTAFAGWMLLRTPHGVPVLSRSISAGVLLAMCLIYAGRAVALATGMLDETLALTGSAQVALLLAAIGLAVAWSFGSMFMVLDRLASVDDLTGMLNRRTILVRSRLLLDEMQLKNRPLSVLMIDLDHFKSINDRYGHSIGDAVLQSFSQVARRALRGSDLIGRYGGEEFCVVLPDTDAQGAREVAERLRRLAEHGLRQVDGHDLKATVSIGIATHGTGQPRDDTIFNLINSADGALYRAKAHGRNRVVGVAPAGSPMPAPG